MGASNSSVAECEYAAKEEDTARKPALDMPATPHTLPPSPPASSLRGKENDGNTVLPNTVERTHASQSARSQKSADQPSPIRTHASAQPTTEHKSRKVMPVLEVSSHHDHRMLARSSASDLRVRGR